MIILGIDPGLAAIGGALVHVAAQSTRSRILGVDSVKTEAGQPLGDRLKELFDFIDSCCGGWLDDRSKPEAIAFEDQAQAQIQQMRDPKRANANVLAIREVVGMVRACGWKQRLDVVQVSPLRAKAAVLGSGTQNATKAQVRAGIKNLPGFDRFRWNEHKTDAVAVAIAGARKLQAQRIGVVPR